MNKMIMILFITCCLCFSISQLVAQDPTNHRNPSFSFEETLLIRRYSAIFSEPNQITQVQPSDLISFLTITGGSKVKSSLQSKKMRLKAPLADGIKTIFIFGGYPEFSINKKIRSECSFETIGQTGYKIVKDVAQLVSIYMKCDTSNHLAVEYLDSIPEQKFPFEDYSYKPTIVAGPTKIWGIMKNEDCTWLQGVVISRKPKIIKEITLSPEFVNPTSHAVALGIWPYQWLSGWAGYTEYSMYFGFVLFDVSTGQKLGSGIIHKDKICDTYCGM